MTASRNLMRIDIHEDDRAARIRLRDQLHQARIDAGIGREAAARGLGITSPFLRNIECSPDASAWLSTFNRLAAFHGLTVVVEPVGVPFYDPQAWTIYDPFPGAANRQYATFARLVEARIAGGRTLVDVASIIGVTASAVGQHEGLNSDTCNLSRWQRYTRALGGQLDLHVVPVESAVAA